MSVTERRQLKRRGEALPPFTPLVHEYFLTQQFANLSPRAVKLLIDVYLQYRGHNNGDLCASWSVMRKRGWTSKDQLGKALAELEATGWLIRTRQGSINRPTLYAVTFRGINHCGGKLDCIADPRPTHRWKFPMVPKVASRRRVRRLVISVPPLLAGKSPPREGWMTQAFRGMAPRVPGESGI